MKFFFAYIILLTLLSTGNTVAAALPEKVWLHRCNSLEKLKEKAEKYAGLEIDIIYRTGVFSKDAEQTTSVTCERTSATCEHTSATCERTSATCERRTPGNQEVLDVTHDEVVTYGLAVNGYFEYLSTQPSKQLWLDIKNLTQDNQQRILAILDSLTRTYGIAHERLIVESRNWQLLAPFTQQGYRTSMYIDTRRPSQMTDEELSAALNTMRTAVDSKAVRCLSFPWWWYPVLHEKLQRPTTPLLTWKHHTTHRWLRLTARGRRMLKDDQLKVILVKDKGKYHR